MSLLSKTFVVTLMVSVMLVWLTQAMRFMDLITSNGISLLSFIRISLMLITPICYIMIPVAIAIAIITLLHHLTSDREIIVLRSAGLSNFQIVRPVMIFATIVLIIEYIFSFYLLPVSYKEFKNLQQAYKNQLIGIFLEEGVFNSQLGNITVYLNEKVKEHYYQGIFIYNNQNPHKPATIIADSGYFVIKDNSHEFILYNGVHQEKNMKTGRLSMVKFGSYNIKLASAAQDPSTRYIDSNEYYVDELLRFRDFENREHRLHFVNGNHRIIWPSFCLSLTLLCAGVMLKGELTRRESSKKIILASGAVALFLVLSLLLNNYSSKNINFLYVMYLNALVALLLGIVSVIQSMPPKLSE